MTELLTRLFIRNRNQTSDPSVRRAYGFLVGLVGMILNVLLAAGKFTVGFLFGSISIQADAVNNLSDAGSQILSLITFRIAARPPDRRHPFGHARIEYVSSMIVSFLILTISLHLFRDSIDKLLHPSETVFSWVSVAVLGVSVLVKLWLCLFNRKISRKIDSAVMRATAADSLSDALSTFAVLAAALIHKWTGFDPDAYMGILVAVFIFISGIRILDETKNSILGERPSEETVDQIRSVVSEFDGALGIHDLIVHNYGPGRIMASLHIEVDGCVDVYKSHDMIDRIERRLRVECGIEATVHMDPISIHDPVVNALREETTRLVQNIRPDILLHDFRVVPGDTHTNLIFDISVPFDCSLSDEELTDRISAAVRRKNPDHFTVITVDRR